MKEITDTDRINLLHDLLGNVPHVTIEETIDEGTEDELGIIPLGWNIRIPNGCALYAATLTAPTFRGVIDKLATWKDYHTVAYASGQKHGQECPQCMAQLSEPSSPLDSVVCHECGLESETDFEERLDEQTEQVTHFWWVRRQQ